MKSTVSYTVVDSCPALTIQAEMILLLSIFFTSFLHGADLSVNFDTDNGTSSFKFLNSGSTVNSLLDSSGNFQTRGGVRLDSDGIKCTSAETMIIDGNTGIGIADPAQKLHVSGNILAGTTFRTMLTHWSTGSDCDLLIPGTSKGTLIRTPPAAHLSIGLYPTGTQESFSIITDSNFDGTPDTVSFFVSGSGNIGILNTNPTCELEISGRLHSESPTFGAYGADSESLCYGYAGNGGYAVRGVAPVNTGIDQRGGVFQVGTSSYPDAYFSGGCRLADNSFRGCIASVRGTDNSKAGVFRILKNSSTQEILAYANLAFRSGSSYYGLHTRSENGVTDFGCYASGSLYDFYAAGSGADYSPFTGCHDVILHPSTHEKIRPGMIVSVTGKSLHRKSGISYTLNEVRLTDTECSGDVFGVFLKHQQNILTEGIAIEPGMRFGIVNSLGEGMVLITDKNGKLSNGSLITASDIPGIGMLQKSRKFLKSTLGKITMNIDWDNISEYINHEGLFFKTENYKIISENGEVHDETKHGPIFRVFLVPCTYHSG